jgi:hypothetical protein
LENPSDTLLGRLFFDYPGSFFDVRSRQFDLPYQHCEK